MATYSRVKRDTRASRSPALRYVLGNGGALLFGLLVAFVILTATGAVSGAEASIKISDFMSYFAALRLIVHGHGNEIYNFDAIRHVQASLMRPLRMPPGFQAYYLYPPYFAILVAPLGYLSFSAAYLIWLGLNCLLLVATLLALESYARLNHRASLVYRFAAVCFLPVFAAFLQGQVSILLLGLFSFALFLARAEMDVPAGVALAFALIKPVYVAPVLLVFLLRRRWLVLGGFVIAAAVLILAPVPILGTSINTQYLHTLDVAAGWTSDTRLIGYGAQGNQSIKDMADLLLPSRASLLLDGVLSAALLLVLARVAYLRDNLDCAFGLAVVAGLLISPHVFIYDLALVWLPLSIALHHRSVPGRYAAGLAALIYVFIFAGYRLAFSEPIHLSVVALGLLGLWLVAAAEKSGPSGIA